MARLMLMLIASACTSTQGFTSSRTASIAPPSPVVLFAYRDITGGGGGGGGKNDTASAFIPNQQRKSQKKPPSSAIPSKKKPNLFFASIQKPKDAKEQAKTPKEQKKQDITNKNQPKASDKSQQQEQQQQKQQQKVPEKQPVPQQKQKRRSMTIPLIGPMTKPLMVGGEMSLDPPSMVEWLSLKHAVEVHSEFLEAQSSNDTSATSTGTAIDAAPIVAIMDEVSARIRMTNGVQGRYATLAAVVGISRSFKDYDEGELDDKEGSFYSDVIDQRRNPLKSRVRLVGIGRALIREIYYNGGETNDEEADIAQETEELLKEEEERMKNGSAAESKMEERRREKQEREDKVKEERMKDNASEKFMEERRNALFEKQDKIKETREKKQRKAAAEQREKEEQEDEKNVVVMAEFDVLADNGIFSSIDARLMGEKHIRSRQVSPVHALAEMNRLVNKIAYLHEERRRLVNALKSAKALLESSDDFVEDVDGLGQLSCGFGGSYLEDLPNYGMSDMAAFMAFPGLSWRATKALEPYYSKEHRNTEEYEMEVQSFVAFSALEGYCAPQSAAWAVAKCTSSVERLTMAYNLMYDHFCELKDLGDQAKRDLLDCGVEECDVEKYF